METVEIVATCTNGKRLPVPQDLHLRRVKGSGPEERAERWSRRLQAHRSKTLAARELYRGHHWSNIRGLPAIAAKAGLGSHLWVASAGYGLVPEDAALHPYSATFSPDNPDAVSPASKPPAVRRATNQAWWQALAMFPGPSPGRPRSITDLAEENRRASVLVVASPRYVVAMEADLLGASESLSDPDRFVIVTSRDATVGGALALHVVPSEAPLLESILGGTRLSLHARTAGKILSESSDWPIRASVLRARFEMLLEESPVPKQYDRQRMTDGEIMTFIRQAREKNPKISCTGLLRDLRDGGRACEQSRFRKLYQEILGGANAS